MKKGEEEVVLLCCDEKEQRPNFVCNKFNDFLFAERV
jgi:hypothetical protein